MTLYVKTTPSAGCAPVNAVSYPKSVSGFKHLNWGFQDTYRLLNPDTDNEFSWFDYRSRGFDDNRGLRIDLILATESLAEKCEDTGIDYELRGIEKPSDHAPVWSTFNV